MGAVILTCITFLTFGVVAQAHDASSGVAYPSDCCTGIDCQVVPCGDIEQIGERQWRHNGVQFNANNVRQPIDGACHVCAWGSIPRCIFFPFPPSS